MPPPRRCAIWPREPAEFRCRPWRNPGSGRSRRGAKEAGLPDPADRLHTLLFLRRAAPSAGIWRGTAMEAPGFVLNLPAFHDAATGFDAEAFAEAAGTAAEALRLAAPGAERYAIAMTDLAGLLALLGLDYASQPARDTAACLAAILRGRTDAAFAGPQPDLLAAIPAWPAPPDRCPVRGLAAAAAEATCAGPALRRVGRRHRHRAAGSGGGATGRRDRRHRACLRPGRAWRADAHRPRLAVGTRDRARRRPRRRAGRRAGVSGRPPGRPYRDARRHRADATRHAAPPGGSTASHPRRRATRGFCPPAAAAFTQKAAIGGHRIFLRTGEYADGPPRRDRHRPAPRKRHRPRPGRQLCRRRQHRAAARRAAGQFRGGVHASPLPARGDRRERPGGRAGRLHSRLCVPQPRRDLSRPQRCARRVPGRTNARPNPRRCCRWTCRAAPAAVPPCAWWRRADGRL